MFLYFNNLNRPIVQQISLENTGAFQKNFIDYITQNPSLASFYGNFPTIEAFEKQIANKQFEHREVLVNTLKRQYNKIGIPENIEKLLDKSTFCVTTGHQLNIFTGPLYVVFKIVSTINLAKKLKEAFPQYNFVPIYWMASEDHDFEEIASFNLFGQTHTWQTTQTGAVGKMNPEGILDIIENLRDKPEIFEKAYKNNANLSDAVRDYMHELFGDKGLITIDSDDHDLKSLFKDIIKSDIFDNVPENIVGKTSEKIEQEGYKAQINARNINFFYLDKNIRERIEKEGDTFKVINTDLVFTKAEIEHLIETEPEKFSPNVVLRGLYQEIILPNLAYLGGPSELVYWLQLKDMFDNYKVPFPILCPRNFGMIITNPIQKKMDKLGLSPADIFEDEVSIKRNYVEKNSENNLSLSTEFDTLDAVFNDILQKAILIDNTMAGVVEAEKAKQKNSLENLEKRIKKAEERNFETAINQLLSVKEKLFPGGTLQERKENFLNFYINDPKFLDILFEAFDPLSFEFNIINA